MGGFISKTRKINNMRIGYSHKTFCIFLIGVLSIVAVSGCTDTNTNISTGTNGSLSAAAALPAWKELTYGSAALTATGGTPPYTCSLKEGSAMPEGFTLSDDCQISGQAPELPSGTTERMTPPFTVVVSDSDGTTVEVETGIKVVKEKPTLVVQAAECTKGEPCHASVVQDVTGGTPPYHYTGTSPSSGLFPLGLSVVNPGVLSGTSSREGTYAIQVCAIDSVGASDCHDTQVSVVKEESVQPPVEVENHTLSLAIVSTERGEASSEDRGTVSISPGGKACSSDCDNEFPENTMVTLTASPAAGSMFYRWEGGCSGTDNTCTVKMDGDKDVTADFAANSDTYHGAFSASGSFYRDSLGCGWSDTITGTVDLIVIEHKDGSVSGWANTDGNFASSGTASACYDTNFDWNSGSQALSGSRSNLRWTASFTTAGGTTVTGANTASISGDGGSIDGSVTFTSDRDSGSASGSFALSKIEFGS